MSERVRNSYFIFVRLALLLAVSICGVMNVLNETGVSLRILLLVSFYIGLMAAKELFALPVRRALAAAGALVCILLISLDGLSFLFVAFFTVYEIFSLFPGLDYKWYFIPLLGALVETPYAFQVQFLVAVMMAVLYVQHNYVVAGYRKQMQEDVLTEQSLKKDMRERESATREELKRSALMAENQILEERASLSQTLHDKLGHNINGSIYQLEGVKLLMEKDPEKSGQMVQAVIDQLRTGMDEIRAILRKERPEKKDLALLQLYKLCEDCNNKGVETDFRKEGDIAQIPDRLWEVILDNAFEAVSNAMKYARCRHIDVRIVVMNKMVRCSIRDDGIGCKEVKDGMGISGMRQRIRAVGGTLDFETEAGFTVTMLMPM
jgi:signal transduction histidine kinase